MAEIDQNLAIEGVGIPGRPIRALGELSHRYSVSLPIVDPIPGAPAELHAAWPVSARVHEWYEEQYGERLKVNFSPGRMAILIQEDLWTLQLPRIYGSARFTVSRTIQSDPGPSSNGPVVYNVVDAVEKLPSSRVSSLPDSELRHIYEKFMFGLQAFGVLEGTSNNDLIASARSDIASSVDHLVAGSPDYGLSKWSSLQAAEKGLKAAIRLAGKNAPRSHNLEKLSRDAEAAGIANTWSYLIPFIQCSAAIRYGEESCGRDDAVRAHSAALAIFIELRNGGAGFQSNLALQQTL